MPCCSTWPTTPSTRWRYRGASTWSWSTPASSVGSTPPPTASADPNASRAAALIGPLPHASAAEIEALADPVLRRRARHVATECARVRQAADALGAGEVVEVGRLMTESHRSLRDDFEVSTEALDDTVSRLMTVPGVLGARLTGAGFGGCVVALCEQGAVADPAEITGRGWLVRPAAGAWVRTDGQR